MKFILSLLFLIFTSYVVKSTDIYAVQSGDYSNQYNWSPASVPTSDDDAFVGSLALNINSRQIEFPRLLSVYDNSVFDILNSQISMVSNSSFQIKDSVSSIDNSNFQGDADTSILIESTQVGATGQITLTDIESFEIKNTLLASYSYDVANKIVAINSNVVLTGSSFVGLPIQTINSTLSYLEYTPQDYQVDFDIVNIINGDLIIKQSNMVGKSQFLINRGSSVLIDESFVVISDAATTFSNGFDSDVVLQLTETASVSVENVYPFATSFNSTGSYISFIGSLFKFSPSSHFFGAGSKIDFNGGVFDVSLIGFGSNSPLSLNLFGGAEMTFSLNALFTGAVNLIDNAVFKYIGNSVYEHIAIFATSFTLQSCELDLSAISPSANQISSLLPMIIGYGSTVFGDGTLISQYVYNYGSLGKSYATSNININGTLLQDDENTSTMNFWISDSSDYSTIKINGDLNINNSTLIINFNSSIVAPQEFTIITFNTIVANSTLFRNIQVNSVNQDGSISELSTGYFITYDNQSIKFVLIADSSSSESSSSSSSSSGASSSEAASSSEDSSETSSSEDDQIICTFSPPRHTLHVINHGEEKIVCTGVGETYCHNTYFECETEQNSTTIKCSTYNEIICVGLNVSCNVGDIFNCNTQPKRFLKN